MKRVNLELRWQVIQSYKELLFVGKEYPLGFAYFRKRLHKAYTANAHLQNEAEIRACLERAEFVKKEITTLYYLKKYRALRHTYEPFT
ncbi:hypothetical protein Cpir12675_003636 [Ceratocystis pirilliformis]|uniref:Uncharacterized protein n=1 Tax=Ceratocystis pirilliformis TaxID=259994 RepID=A0ABR3Z372_9PEZI